MNILLTSYAPYYYLHKELLSAIVDGLRTPQNEVYFLPTDLHFKQEVDLTGVKQFTLSCELPDLWKKAPRLFRAPIVLLKCLAYRYLLMRRLKKIHPAILVIPSSDLISYELHILQDLCQELRIPILIIVNINSLSNQPHPCNIRINQCLRKILSIFKLERAILFSGTVVGTYLSTSHIAVSGIFTKKQLLRSGIADAQLFVTGNPVHDKLIGLRTSFSKDLKNNMQIPKNYIVYCTEVIEFIYGEEYFYWINDQLHNIFDCLPDSIEVIIKLHPRESKSCKTYLQQLFKGPRYRIIEATDLYVLLINSRLIITHFSATIIESILVGTPVLRINVKNDDRYLELVPDNAMLVAASLDEISEKMSLILFDETYRKKVMDYLDSWIKPYAAHLDGNNTSRVVGLIGILANQEG